MLATPGIASASAMLRRFASLASWLNWRLDKVEIVIATPRVLSYMQTGYYMNLAGAGVSENPSP
jgi:hypothetical protein